MNKIKNTVLIPVLVVFVAVMVVVIISFSLARNSIQREIESNVQDYSTVTQGAVRDRLNVFEETLRAGLGLFAGNGSVTKEEFNRFISTSAVLERYTGAQNVAYAKVTAASEVPEFVAAMRSSVDPNFTIRPEGNREQYAPVIYIEPQSDANNRVIGFDTYSEKTRATALNQARDSGNVTITGAIQSLVDDTQAGRAFIMYAPQYKLGMPIDTIEQRRVAIEGYIYAGFRVSRFMESVINDSAGDNMSFSISIGNSKEELYKGTEYEQISSAPHGTLNSSTVIGSTMFNFEFVYDQSVLSGSGSVRPIAILAFGTVLALLIAGAVWLILRGKANELLLEQERGINEAKDNLLSLASHQLRTPATGVKQYLGLVIQGFAGEVTQQQQSLLESAYTSNERQLKTINDVLYLARLGSGRIVLSKSQFSAHRLVSDIVNELSDEAKMKQHALGYVPSKSKKKFYGDEHMIRMAVENLLTNAIKYTRSGGTIKVKVTQSKASLRIMVEDNGVGIESSQQDRLFEQFERIDNDLSIAVGGSGIGLYVVRNIAGLHNGHVEVSSELDAGSQFTIVLPYEEVEET